MKRYFISYTIMFANNPFYGNCTLEIKNKFDINEIEKRIAQTSLNLIKKKNEYLKLKQKDINPIILFFKELKDYEI